MYIVQLGHQKGHHSATWCNLRWCKWVENNAHAFTDM